MLKCLPNARAHGDLWTPSVCVVCGSRVVTVRAMSDNGRSTDRSSSTMFLNESQRVIASHGRVHRNPKGTLRTSCPRCLTHRADFVAYTRSHFRSAAAQRAALERSSATPIALSVCFLNSFESAVTSAELTARRAFVIASTCGRDDEPRSSARSSASRVMWGRLSTSHVALNGSLRSDRCRMPEELSLLLVVLLPGLALSLLRAYSPFPSGLR